MLPRAEILEQVTRYEATYLEGSTKLSTSQKP
jgi:hypothetical protein